MGRTGEGRSCGKHRPQKNQGPKPSPAQPSPEAQVTANPTLGKQLAPPRLLLPLALSGAAGHRAHGKEEKMQGERDEKPEGKGRGLQGIGRSPWEGRRQRGRVPDLVHCRAEDLI